MNKNDLLWVIPLAALLLAAVIGIARWQWRLRKKKKAEAEAFGVLVAANEIARSPDVGRVVRGAIERERRKQ